MSKKRPIIAITHSVSRSKVMVMAIKLAVWFAGGKPVSITTQNQSDKIKYQGLILCGGLDINPEIYGKIKKPGYQYDSDRDSLELYHLAHAEKTQMPVFGICRGCQLMNIHRGGTLHTDITKVYEYTKYPSTLIGYIFFRKRIHIEKTSALFKITQKTGLKVNSIHRQSIANLGLNLMISAVEKNQIIQGIEDSRHPFFIGVQFHPEFLIYKKPFLKLFQTFVHHAKSQNTD